MSESRQTIAILKARRAALAASIREGRALAREAFPGDPEKARRVARVVVREDRAKARTCLRPTRAAFLAKARELLSYSPRYGRGDSEYYSACGLDDAAADAAHEARRLGYLYRRAARYL